MSTEPVLGVFSFLASDTYKESEKLIHTLIDQLRSWRELQRYVRSLVSPAVGRHSYWYLSICGLDISCSIYEGVSVDEDDPNRRWLILGRFTYLCSMPS